MLTQKIVLVCTLGASLTMIGADKTPPTASVASFPVSDGQILNSLLAVGNCLAGCFWGCLEKRSCMNSRDTKNGAAPEVLIMGSKQKPD